MAKQQSMIAVTNATDAQFREWAQFIHDAMALAGFAVESTVTGQINLSTVTRPTTNGAVQGFEVWKTNDGLTTWYIKIEYGGYGASVLPAVWITIGTSFNTSGTILGNASPQTRVAMASGSATNTRYPCFASGRADVDEGNSVNVAMFCDATGGYGIIFNIERAHNAEGAIDADAIMMIVGGVQSGDFSSIYVPRTGGVPPQTTSSALSTPQVSSNYFYNQTVAVVLYFAQKGGLYAFANLLGGYSGAGQFVTASFGGTIRGTIFGKQRTYIVLTTRPYFGRVGESILMRFE